MKPFLREWTWFWPTTYVVISPEHCHFRKCLIRNLPVTVQIWSHVTRGLSFHEISVWRSRVVKHTRWKNNTIQYNTKFIYYFNNQIWKKFMNPFITRSDEPFAVKERQRVDLWNFTLWRQANVSHISKSENALDWSSARPSSFPGFSPTSPQLERNLGTRLP